MIFDRILFEMAKKWSLIDNLLFLDAESDSVTDAILHHLGREVSYVIQTTYPAKF